MRRIFAVLAVVASFAGPALADRPIDVMRPMNLDPRAVPSLINSHVLFLNRCAGGCRVLSGNTDSTTDRSDIGQGNLSAFSDGDAKWMQVMDCMKSVMMPFNITVTDVDPGTAPHFEVMIGGDPSQLGLPNGVGGIADYTCSAPGQCQAPYIPNALVFDFSDVWQGDTLAICGTAAQEIAHAWNLDHATEANDPMTYNNYTSSNFGYKDNSPCGSDCLYNCPSGTGACNAFGVTCSGSGLAGTHVCMDTGNATQDEVQTIIKLFGPANAPAPALAIMNPKNGSAQQPGFGIDVTCTSPAGIEEVDLMFDGQMTGTLTATPFHFQAPGSLPDGIHHISVLCGTNQQATAMANADIVTGKACAKDADCMTAGDICYEMVCVAGPMATGGIGSPCTSNDMCALGACASDGQMSLCVIPCDPNNDQCPSGFGCVADGTGGVCWFGADKAGGGCCDSGHDHGNGGAILAGLGFAALLVKRRRR